jgi:4-diphosphocytidyl-2-C-methyl-D-erythritol kinase
MQAIDLTDTLSFSRTSGGVEIVCSDPAIPTDRSNLIARAWEVLRKQFGLPGGIRVELEKRIPVGAGLGGGSSDAAATMKALNRMYDLGLSRSFLSDLGSELGSDVPFFFSTGSAIAEGRGELITDVELPLDYHILLVVPDFRIETKNAYDSLRNFLTNYSTKSSLPVAISGAGFYNTLKSIGNDFRALACSWHPALETAFNELLNAGAPHVALSGSGSAFFSLFSETPEPRIKQDLASHFGWRVLECTPVCLDW